jgi:hypothetical protein
VSRGCVPRKPRNEGPGEIGAAAWGDQIAGRPKASSGRQLGEGLKLRVATD